MVPFLCMFFPPVIALVITKKLRKEEFSNLQYAAYYVLFTLGINTIIFLVLSFLFRPHWITAPDVFSTSFAAKYSVLASFLAIALAYGVEFCRRFVSEKGGGKFIQQGDVTVKGLGHLAIRVKDVEESVKFYRDTLGFPEAFRINDPDTGNLYAVNMYVAPSQFIEILPSGSEEQMNDNAIGLKHFCVEVDSAEKFQEELRAKGAPIDEEIKTGISKCIFFWTHDPDGNKIEFMELPPDSFQAEANRRIAEGEDDDEEEDEE